MSRSGPAYAVIGLLDPEHRIKIGLSGLLCGTVLVVVLTPLFTDLFQTLALRSPSEDMRHWGPLVVGVAAALLVTFAGIAAGVPSVRDGAWWRDRKVRVTLMLLGLGAAIALARFSKGVATIRAERQEVLAAARAELEAARRMVTSSREAESILSSIKEADRLIGLGTRRRWPKIRQHGFRLRSEARQAQSELKAASEKAIERAEVRLAALPAAHDIPVDEVLRLVAGPALTELVFAELGALVMAFWASVAAAPIRRRRWTELEEEGHAGRAVSYAAPSVFAAPVRAEPQIQDEDIERVEFEVEPAVDGGTPHKATSRHRSLRGVDEGALDLETSDGLDWQRGEWHTLPLRSPALRRIGNRRVLWPVIDINGPKGRIIFAGSQQAFALLPQRVREAIDAMYNNSDRSAAQNGDTSLPLEKWLEVKKDEEPN